MILSSRQIPPRLPSLVPPPPQRPPSYKFNNNTLSLAASSAIHLLQNSPLPSPSLPSILPRHGKKPPKLNSKAIVHVLAWLAGLILLFWATKHTLLDHRASPGLALDSQSTNGKAPEIVVDDTLPHYSTPVIVTDARGHSKWTVSIPQHLAFPLKPSDYSDMCAQAQDVSQQVANLKSLQSHHDDTENPPPPPVHAAHYSYYHVDPTFVDVAEAQESGLLPRPIATAFHPPKDKVCAKSLTYVLESSSGGLAPTLMGLWLAYGLAQHEDRAFFVDDTRWEYGTYATFFRHLPTPACLPPPDEQRVPCPHQAAHLVASAATTPWTFGAAFLDAFEDGRKMGVRRLERVFGMLRGGYEALFRLADEGDVQFLSERAGQLRTEVQDLDDNNNTTGVASSMLQVGVHIRHGDRHPYEFQYSGSYLPITTYLDAAHEIAAESAAPGSTSALIVIASDDPDVYASAEVQSAGVRPAQHRLWLTAAWGGGFFPELFWSLGKHDAERLPRAEGSPRPSRREAPPQQQQQKRNGAGAGADNGNELTETMQLRQAVARAYLLDLAVLGCTDRVVCGVSSHSCRVLAVMMGWERAIEQGQWRNVDGDWGWRGLDW